MDKDDTGLLKYEMSDKLMGQLISWLCLIEMINDMT